MHRPPKPRSDRLYTIGCIQPRRSAKFSPLTLTGVVSAAAGWLLFGGVALLAREIVIVRQDSPIAAVGPDLPLTEPFVAVNPEEPLHLVAGAIVAPTGQSKPWRCAAFVSRDGGGAWSRHDFDMEGCIDPWVLFTHGGDVLFTGIEIRQDGEDEQRFRLVLFRSVDGGLEWPTGPMSLGRAHDHQMLITAATPGTIYLTSRRTRRTPEGQPRHTVYVARSRDDGKTFHDLAEVRPSNVALNPTGIVQLSHGALIVSYFDFQRNVDGFNNQGILARARAWLVRSNDGGETFSESLLITDGCASGVEGGFPGYPFLAADTTPGPFQDRLYHVCIAPGFRGVALAHSSDAGETWSDVVRVDVPPKDGLAHARTPMVAVNREGVVGAAWYDRRHDPARECQDFYFTASSDGGETFVEPRRISTETSCPNSPGNGRAGRSWAAGGDYSSITAGPDGLFHLLWADSRSGIFRLRHASVRVSKSRGGPESAYREKHKNADLIGLDTILYSLEVLYESYNDDKFRPCPLLRKMVHAGLHGRKSGEGFYPYGAAL